MDGCVIRNDSIARYGGPRTRQRLMVRAELMGRHSHSTRCGVTVHICMRDGNYLARGRYDNLPFGLTLGREELLAETGLRQLLTAIENGSFVRPSEARRSLLAHGPVPRLTIRELAELFLSEKRRLKGLSTATTYRSRLAPVLNFTELTRNRRKWPMAQDIDRPFAVGLRVFLHQYLTTRNGRAGGVEKHLSAKQIVHALETVRSMLRWASRAEVRKLPPDWTNPFTPDIVGKPPAKDPLQDPKLPIALRSRLVGAMDEWELCQLASNLLLPMRPEQSAGLLISDVNFESGCLSFTTRLSGADFTKGHTSFKIPFPEQLKTVLQRCVDGRPEGPLLRCPKAFLGAGRYLHMASSQEVAQLYEKQLANEAILTIENDNDRKHLFRRLLIKLGGVCPKYLAKRFKRLATALGQTGISLKEARSAVSTDLKRSGIDLLDLRYLTGHTTSDIMNQYVTLDPYGAMEKYWLTAGPLLDEIEKRAKHFGL